ncbi:tetratricopeptide repeat protein [Flavobacterium sp. H122]|uniref:tetratricopeptide repeat protein n=1 Tax=Flavobacterium sp. H122 TaxID=2529860 RepID=UPI0010A99F5F|nr:tetratricopeptide repeat protein [Flavobacterium sp. H122]
MKFLLNTSICFFFAFSYSQTNTTVNDSLLKKATQLRSQEKYQESMEVLNKISSYSPEKNKAVLEKSRVMYYDKKYDDAIELLTKIDKSSFEKENLHDYYLILGNVYDDAGKEDKALELYKEALQLFPESYLIHYNKGVTNSRLNHNEEAYKDLINSITIYPNFYRSHYLLGVLAFNNGNQSEGILAMTTSILLDFGGQITENAVKKLNYELSKKYEDPKQPFQILGHELFESAENIIKKQYALNSSYKLNSDFDIVYIRQLQALLSELPKIKTKNGFFAERYNDFYAKVWQDKQFETLTYRLFLNFNTEAVQKLVAKKANDITKFNSWMFTNITKTICSRKVDFFGKEDFVSVIDEDGYIGYGKLINDKKDGLWRFNYSDGNRFLEGKMTENKFDGEVNAYYQDGKKNNTVNYLSGIENGKAEFYYLNGNLISNREFLNEKENNKQTFYHRFGGLKSYYNVKNEKAEGKEEVFYKNGKLKSAADYVNGNINGDYKEYFVNGTLKTTAKYEAGKINGDKIEYFPNSVVFTKESYLNGNTVGEYVKNYPNGDLYNSFKLENGKIVYFKEMLADKISEERFFNGDRLSRQKIYLKGKPIVEYIFEGKEGYEHLMAYKTFDANGNPQKEVKLKLNTPFIVKLANNNTYLEGAYNSKGQKHGEWKYYDPVTGLLDSHTYYDKNVQVNKYEDFYPNGKLKTVYEIKEGQKNGSYITYYKNGTKESESYYIKDVQNGESKRYHKNGKLKNIYFLSNGMVDGELERFNNLGEMYERSIFIKDELVKTSFYNKGTLISAVDYEKNGPAKSFQKNTTEISEGILKNGEYNGDYFIKNNKNQKIFEAKLENGEKFGTSISYNPNHTVSVKSNYTSNILFGEYTKNNLDGKLYWKANYFNDVEFGLTEKYFHEGFKFLATNYFNGKKNGEEIYYGNNGEELITLNYENGMLISYKKQTENEVLTDKGNAVITANYKNGKPALEINYKNGELNGTYKFYAENGNLLINSEYNEGDLTKRAMNYMNGKPYFIENLKDNDYEGVTTYFYPNGKVKIEANYSNDELNGMYKEYDESGKVIVEKKYEDDILVENK